MRTRLLIAAIVLLLAAVLLAPSSSTKLPGAEKLLFQQAGPRNGSMPDFTIAPGPVSNTTRATIYVAPSAYAKITALVSQNGRDAFDSHEQVFSITEFKDSKPQPPVFLKDKAVGELFDGVIRAYKADHQAVPDIVSEIAASLSHAK